MMKLELTPRLALTLALHQSQTILQMSQLELTQWLKNEIEKNPLLRWKERSRRYALTDTIPARFSLYASLMQQIEENFANQPEKEMAQKLVGQLDEKGFLPDTTPDSSLLAILQTFHPPGIFARNLKECLLLQLKKEGVGYKLVQCHFEDLMGKKWSILQRKMGLELKLALKELGRCVFRPGMVDEPWICPITPDLVIEKTETGWGLRLIEEELPEIELEESYDQLKCENREESEQLRAFKTQAKWIERSLNRRRKMLKSIGKIIVCRQALFLDKKGALKELTVKEIAEKMEVHESTISRAIADKYIATPRGIFSFRYFFTTSAQTQSAKELIGELIRKEQTISDKELALRLQTFGHKIARRTVTKYRKQLNIGTKSQRKRFGIVHPH